MRKVAGILLGVFVSFAIISMCDVLASSFFSMPDIRSADPATLAAAIAGIPLVAKLIIAGSWFVAPLAGAWLGLRISDWATGGWIVTGLFLAVNLYNQVLLPHPLWMQVASVALPLIGGWLGQRLHVRPYAGEPLLG